MAEEFRFFLRTGLYVAAAGAVYWLASHEPAGTVLLVALLVAIVALVWAGRAMSGTPSSTGGGSGPLGWLNRIVGFTEDTDEPPPLAGGPEAVPLASAWPIVTAAGTIIAGLGLVFGAWLLIPGLVLLVAGLVGWMAQTRPAG